MPGVALTCYDSNTLTTAEIYGHVLCELGEFDPKIVGLSADLAKSTKIGLFWDKYPDRFFNCGIAEQNMFGIAAGLAASGLIPVVSTFAAFASMRAGEQVRTDICYPRLNVKIIATHAGLSFGPAGSTHHCHEDLAIMRSFPNIAVIAPADGNATAAAVRAAYEYEGPVYIRIGRGFSPSFYQNTDFGFEIGKAVTLRDGTDITLIACGICVYHAMEAARELERNGISARVIDMHTIKPIDEEVILKAVQETRRIVTIEEHNIQGGLGSAVADVIAASGKGCAFFKGGLPDEFCEIGDPEDLYSYYRLDSNGILEIVQEVLKADFEQDEDWTDEV